MHISTNWIERINRKYKRTIKIRTSMPTSKSVLFLLTGGGNYGSINAGFPFEFFGSIFINFSIRRRLTRTLKSISSSSTEKVI